MILTKSVFKPFIENVYFQRGEKDLTKIKFVPNMKEQTLRVELRSILGLFFSITISDLEEGSLDTFNAKLNTDYTFICTYSEFCKTIKNIKARTALKIKINSRICSIVESNKKANLNDEVPIVMHLMKPDINGQDIDFNVSNTTMLGDVASLNSIDLHHTSYLSGIKLDNECVPEFKSVILKQEENNLCFIATSGSSLHCCKVEMDDGVYLVDNKSKMFTLPSPYIKNMTSLGDTGVSASFQLVKQGAITQIEFVLTDSYITLFLPVEEVTSDIYDELIPMMLDMEPDKLVPKTDTILLDELISTYKSIKKANDLAKFDMKMRFTKHLNQRIVIDYFSDKAIIGNFDSEWEFTIQDLKLYECLPDKVIISAFDFFEFLTVYAKNKQNLYWSQKVIDNDINLSCFVLAMKYSNIYLFTNLYRL